MIKPFSPSELINASISIGTDLSYTHIREATAYYNSTPVVGIILSNSCIIGNVYNLTAPTTIKYNPAAINEWHGFKYMTWGTLTMIAHRQWIPVEEYTLYSKLNPIFGLNTHPRALFIHSKLLQL